MELLALRETSFGRMRTLAERQGEPIAEWLEFERNGRAHQHDRWEHVRVLSGEGWIAFGANRLRVGPGTACSIPPRTDHWMETESRLELVLLYGDSFSG